MMKNRTETETNIGLGLAALGRPGYINLGHAEDLQSQYDVGAMEQHAHTVLDTAWELGVRYFDAARSYGKAESFLASWIAKRDFTSNEINVGSKWGYTYTANWQIETPAGVAHEVKQHHREVLDRQFDISQSNLADHLKLYQIHSATLDSGVLDNDDVLDRLAQIAQSGVKIGLSVSGVGQSDTIEKALEILVDGIPLFSSVQATWNLLETSAGPALANANRMGLNVIVKESLANGRLTDRNNSPSFQPKIALLQNIARTLETTIDALAIAAAVAQPWATTVLSGAANSGHLRSNYSAVDVACDENVLQQLSALREPSEEYWSTRAGLAWN